MNKIDELNERIKDLNKSCEMIVEELIPLAQDAKRLDLYIDGDYKVHGDADKLEDNAMLVKRIEYAGARLLEYKKELKEAEAERDKLPDEK